MSIRYGAGLTALGLFLLLAGPGTARAQGCCTPGSSPLGGLAGSLPEAGRVEVGLWVDSFSLDQTYRGTERVEDFNNRRGRVTRAAAFVRAGLPAGTALLVEWPWESRGRDQFIGTKSGDQELNFDNRAPGDISTLLLFQIWPRRGVSRWGVEAGVGVKWANGSVDRSDDGRFLPVELQSGTGSTDPLLSLTVHRTGSPFSVLAASLFRAATTGRNRYRFGNELNAVTSFNWAATPVLAVGVDVRVRLAGQDEFESRTPASTGGERILAGPRLTVTARPLKLRLYGAWLLPVHHNLNGIQLGVSRQILLGASWPAT